MHLNIFHCLVMVWSKNQPDLRPPKSKFRDMPFVGTDALINSWTFYVDPFGTVATAQWQIFLEVGSLDVTWWPDLGWSWAEIFWNVAEKMYEKGYAKKRLGTVPPFFRYWRKTLGGHLNPPHVPARVNTSEMSHFETSEQSIRVINKAEIVGFYSIFPSV